MEISSKKGTRISDIYKHIVIHLLVTLTLLKKLARRPNMGSYTHCCCRCRFPRAVCRISLRGQPATKRLFLDHGPAVRSVREIATGQRYHPRLCLLETGHPTYNSPGWQFFCRRHFLNKNTVKLRDISRSM